MPKSIAFLGAGNIATALAVILAKHEIPIRLYSIEDAVTREINLRHRNTKYLKGINLPKNISACAHPSEALKDAEAVIIAVPSHAIKKVMELSAPHFEQDSTIGCITKGLDPITLKPIAYTVTALLPKNLKKNLCVIGGPAVAMELAIKKPAGLILAGEMKPKIHLKKLLENENLRIAISSDFMGVSMAMALKNIYAVPLGLCDGLNYPTNTKAMVITAALDEMSRILKAIGAEQKTTFSLAGLGDLLVTGLSPHGRNRTYGERLVYAKTRDPQKLGLMTVEGIPSCFLGIKLVKKLKLEAPLLRTVARCLSAKKHFEKPFLNYLKNLKFS
ncbi:MAG: NAD(P)H-dependent glycerol-3-phosphate dehydrogenase [Patescibacteria group bacterium]